MSTKQTFFRQNWPVLLVFVGALGAALWYSGNVVLDMIYFNDPRHQDETLKAWMTPRYIVMSYDLPREMVAEILELEPDDRGRNLSTIAEARGMTLDEMTERVRAAAEEFRAQAQ